MAAAKYEHMTCEYEPKPHKWKRELGQRGRKPRFCPKHKPTQVSIPGVKAEAKTLHCELGNHEWVREPTRGRVPTSCPEHKATPVIVSAPRNKNGKVTLHCEIGNHDWEREPKRGRKPSNCDIHSSTPVATTNVSLDSDEKPVPRKVGRPRLHESDEERDAAALAKSRERVDLLEGALKERGTHLSQQSPYILYKKIGEKKGRGKTPPQTTWEKVTEHSPLAQAQYINGHMKDFADGLYRYERNGKVVVL